MGLFVWFIVYSVCLFISVESYRRVKYPYLRIICAAAATTFGWQMLQTAIGGFR